jgi:hypothetical protein
MSRYCCFFCASHDSTDKSLTDTCPNCSKEYGFAQKYAPAEIREYKVIRELGRGFYGVTYVVNGGRFNRPFVLKISPVNFYSEFEKTKRPFDQEVELHDKIARSADHVVGIVDAFDAIVKFSDPEATEINCNVTVLEFVDGKLLKDYLSGKENISASLVCQIAIDLLRIRQQFSLNQLNHNDLHAENVIVEILRSEARRSNCICDNIKVKAIDLGSVGEESKSNETRLGDLSHIAGHIDGLLNQLLADIEKLDDRDYRVVLALQGVVAGLLSQSQNVRLPDTDDLIQQIGDAFARASHPWRPWNLPLNLTGFANHYNAQTLGSWEVPNLIVDPQERWLAKTTIPGPQFITGMRGCGKTMLLRAIDIHARAAMRANENSKAVLDRIQADGFVGLFVSAQKLLDLKSQSLYKLEYRVSRLFVSYALQAARALMHLRDIDPSKIVINSHQKLANAVANYLSEADDLRKSTSLDDLERRLTNIMVWTTKGTHLVSASPNELFNHLANEFTECSEILINSKVFFLLDDVSTRYHDLDRIGELLSALLFQEPKCAFKFTTEWQTIELGLKSPGREHPIREGRDLVVFDLGSDVLEMVGSRGKAGKEFVAQILLNRAKLHASHPKQNTPSEILGDVALEQVAFEIASNTETSDHKKNVYRGISCLSKVCVGDIGDVIKLYEEIIRKASGKAELPIPANIQSECFRNLGSQRLYDLNRRDGYFKDHALAFASASHDLLVRSYKIGKKEGKVKPRLRQYTSIYVRITTDDESAKTQQIDRLRELIDASVFVYSGSAPRTKTKDSNPTQQFILGFRKIYGLSASIGLSDRDRFELSGDDLQEWLENPSKAKEILLRNQITAEDAFDEQIEELLVSIPTPKSPSQTALIARDLFENTVEVHTDGSNLGQKLNVSITRLYSGNIDNLQVNTVFTGLGFEDRTLKSNRFLSRKFSPQNVIGIIYPMKGFTDEIIDTWRKKVTLNAIKEAEAMRTLPNLQGISLIDITGLSKPFIYEAIKQELKEKGLVYVSYTKASEYYPTESELTHLFEEELHNEIRFMDGLASILNGESGPYSEIRLRGEPSDVSRSRALIGFASAKHERLFSLLDRREYDYIEIIGPNDTTLSRSKVAAHSAKVACKNFNNAAVTLLDIENIEEVVNHLDTQYLKTYGQLGANVEFGLTGTKLEAVAAAIVGAKRKISETWYLKPQSFDETRFSKGFGQTLVFKVSLK